METSYGTRGPGAAGNPRDSRSKQIRRFWILAALALLSVTALFLYPGGEKSRGEGTIASPSSAAEEL